ncbi:MAG: Eco57I restriction-modification methylase domain-containing protein [Methanolobus sp.]|uniref:Eco57I restriction-modification methylase domain-containing protein n=1 Tax=Methanolobus sp. TaxID=1874737 RepID=UPI00272F6F66|nr:N-6 DNA methylase [Methanolobus sp.]MDP2217491.1 Eco57I restriction-modification methylase domain-containing protein [Methanolobus sp.]
MPVPPAITELVERFNQYYSKYTSPSYNETQVRREFIDPLFKALGWDVDNTQAYDERYKEVIHEDAVKVGGKTKAPDYSFRIGGSRKFFVEAKKPAVNLKENPEPAYQLRRYAWSAKLPISILTDFEEFIVYDCTKKPSPKDKSSLGRIEYYTYKDYIEKWDEIESKYSKKAIFTGRFDDLADSLVQKKGGKGTAGIDDAFLAEIEGWRDELARNIAIRNTSLSVRELNLAVQKIIDRLIFLRICEDRGIEEYEQLKKRAEGKDVYKNLINLFLDADDKYNSGIFHFRNEDGMDEPDILTTSLEIDDRTLKHIIGRLYYPESPYVFSVIPADILGQVYEQFLGKVIRLTASHQAKIEEKPEVKKAGGVFYTPTYIVDYIVKNTVGEVVKSKTPTEVSDITIVDPACGSGSFLIGAYQYLLDWHVDWYMNNLVPLLNSGKSAADKDIKKLLPIKPATKKKGRTKKEKREARSAGSDYYFPIYQASEDDWRLTSDEKKRILLNNIYGVDIDQQAVEVTKLSLLLKVLEGEKKERISKQLTITHERVLPSLHENIKCGNSLIGPDIYSNGQMTFESDEDFYRVNAFDWYQEFSDVFDEGGFDAVIGNPPYIRIQAMKEWAPIEVEFYKKLYKSASKGNYDIYVVFVEKGLSLLNDDGLLGYILPHKFFNAQYGKPLRELIDNGKYIRSIVHFGHQQVFANATTYTCLLFLTAKEQDTFIFESVEDLDDWKSSGRTIQGEISSGDVTGDDWNFLVGEGGDLYRRLQEFPLKLEDVTYRIFQGVKTSADKIYIVEEVTRQDGKVKIYSPEKEAEYWMESDLLHPLVKGGDSKRYRLSTTNRLILFPYAEKPDGKNGLMPESVIIEKYPLTWHYLLENKKYLENRENGKMKGAKWYGYVYPKALDVMQLPKIFTPDLVSQVSFSIDETGEIFFTGGASGGYGILIEKGYSQNFILGLLNSKLTNCFLQQFSTKMRGGWFSCEARFIKHIPVCTIDPSNPEDVAKHDKIVFLVEQMLELQKKLDNTKLGNEKEMIHRRISAKSAEIDRLVYELYGMTTEEIAIIEDSLVRNR